MAKMQSGGSGGKGGDKSGNGGNGGNGGQGNGQDGNGNGGGMGGSGTGDGGTAPEADSDYTETDAKLHGKMHRGSDIVGQYFKRGNPPSGEARKKLGEVIDRSRQEAQDAMNDQGHSPAERKLVSKYFDYLHEHFGDTDSASEDK